MGSLGLTLACVSGRSGEVSLWDPASGSLEDHLNVEPLHFANGGGLLGGQTWDLEPSVAFMGRQVVVGLRGLTIGVPGKRSRTFNPLVGVQAIAVSPGQLYIATRCNDDISIWRVSANGGVTRANVLRRFTAGNVQHIAWIDDRTLLVAGNTNPPDPDTGACTLDLYRVDSCKRFGKLGVFPHR